VPEQLLTPSKITAWLDCPHFLTLRHEVDSGAREQPPHMFGEMAQMLLDKGLDHEAQVLAGYEAAGRTVHRVPDREDRESFAAWAARVSGTLDDGHDVVYQMPLVHDGIRGVADFLERVDVDGQVTYEPVDAKLARSAAKPGHVLQLCFYAEAIAAQTGRAPEHVHIELGSGSRESIRVEDVMAYWRRLRSTLAALVEEAPRGPTVPEPCDHCGFCEFEPVCQAEWRAADSLIYVAGARRADREQLAKGGVDTLAGLAVLDHPIDGLDLSRQDTLHQQAVLQDLARLSPDDPPPFRLITPEDVDDEPISEVEAQSEEPSLRGFAALPEPDDGDVFLDYEGHPFWKADTGLFFLFGFIEQDAGKWKYKAFWAHDRAGEAQATVALVEYLHARLVQFPQMHVYHYNHTERSALKNLTEEYGVVEREVEAMIARGLFVDLYPIVTGAAQVGVESYGLKHIERLTDYQRSHDIDRGSGAVIEYERWMGDSDEARLQRIARYNEDDVRATLAVRDWLIDHRPEDVAWRDSILDPVPDDPELDARIEALHAHEPGSAAHLMGDLLGYWRRESRVVAADSLRLSMADEHEQFESPRAIARLTYEGIEDRFSPKTGRKLSKSAVTFRFPTQEIDADIRDGATLILARTEHEWAFFTVESIDPESGTLTVLIDADLFTANQPPTCLVHHPKFNEKPKQAALSDLADRMLAGDGTAVGHAILRGDRTKFLPGRAPAGGTFVGDTAHVCAWAPHLDGSYAPVQGPPGTGKTYTGAHVIHTLVTQGKRVGITAMSHNAIDNLTKDVANQFAKKGDTLRAVRKAKDGGPVIGVDYTDDNKKCATGEYDVIAGTPWLFASKPMREHPVDVLIIDEAGQLGLADTLAASISATNVILLGDPQQLPQVAQASHPNRCGVSALEHLLGEGARTFPRDRGVLLDVTYRMHPDVCGFISDVMYEGRLTSDPSCAAQTTSAAGTGLRWIRAQHTQRSTESPEEAAIVAATIRGLLGTDWTDQHGVTGPLTAADFIVVTPYNDQRRLITAELQADAVTAGVEVGTVDKFQGRQAAVILFSMTTSSAEFMPRDASFLFSKNRLNVAISRARCLAYLICTDDLLDTRARDVPQMTLISALCSFVERSKVL
jgi:uncharacterized protein